MINLPYTMDTDTATDVYTVHPELSIFVRAARCEKKLLFL